VDKGLADWKWDLPPSAEEQITTVRNKNIIATDADTQDELNKADESGDQAA